MRSLCVEGRKCLGIHDNYGTQHIWKLQIYEVKQSERETLILEAQYKLVSLRKHAMFECKTTWFLFSRLIMYKASS